MGSNISFAKDLEIDNNIKITSAFIHNKNKVLSLVTSIFNWENLPDEIDKRFIEISLIKYGQLAFFYEEEVKQFCILPFTVAGLFDIYNNPKKIQVFANNGYTRILDTADCVLIFDNTLRSPLIRDVLYYANRLTELDKCYNVNLENQKTPLFVMCDESERLTMVNAFLQVKNGMPVIFASKDFDPENFKTQEIKPEFICDKLYREKQNLYNEILSFFGVQSAGYEKKERLTNEEISAHNAQSNIYRFSRFEPRAEAARRINNKFGLNIEISENYVTPMTESEGVNIE